MRKYKPAPVVGVRSFEIRCKENLKLDNFKAEQGVQILRSQHVHVKRGVSSSGTETSTRQRVISK